MERKGFLAERKDGKESTYRQGYRMRRGRKECLAEKRTGRKVYRTRKEDIREQLKKGSKEQENVRKVGREKTRVIE